MKKLGTMIFASAMGVGALAMTSTGASARIVCNDDGDCRHVKRDYDYRPDFQLRIHPDNWRWKEGENYHWREHEGRGYWNHGAWTEF